MVLARSEYRFAHWRFPHARGDGPQRAPCPVTSRAFSPRPWGWSVVDLDGFGFGGVFPTPVGMVRPLRCGRCRGCGFPHARGDGPRGGRGNALSRRFSPRPWGWSGRDARDAATCHVFPTPVGMVRVDVPASLITVRFPHARGDGPPIWRPMPWRARFSPRPWGWSASLDRWEVG